MLKGFIRSVQSLSLIAFVNLITIDHDSEEQFSGWRFWIMGGALILASPFLYFGIPELRHLGRSAGEFFFLPAQTIFYFIPNEEEAKTRKTLKIVANVITAARAFQQAIDKASTDEEEETYQREKTVTYQREKTVERMGAENMIATFHQNTLEELLNNEELAAKNKLSLTFVENILGMNNWLVQNPNPNRLIVARGPARFVKENFNVGIFLFSDVVIVARKLKENRKYRVEETFDIDKNFEVSRDGTEVTFANGAKSCLVSFSELGNARMWEQYAVQCKTAFL